MYSIPNPDATLITLTRIYSANSEWKSDRNKNSHQSSSIEEIHHRTNNAVRFSLWLSRQWLNIPSRSNLYKKRKNILYDVASEWKTHLMWAMPDSKGSVVREMGEFRRLICIDLGYWFVTVIILLRFVGDVNQRALPIRCVSLHCIIHTRNTDNILSVLLPPSPSD